ncbi:MAG: RHS repeat-associated core domain-containing protein [Phycisphaerae bacterium]
MGSSVLTTNAQSGSSSGARMSRRYYTAFGERVAELGESGQPPPAWAATTFGYCGAWGYEGSAEWPTESNFGSPSSNDDFWESDLGVLHVGARWYWPETGRFLQRDPMGIAGGLNGYAYADSAPIGQIDPQGLAVWRWRNFWGSGFAGGAAGATRGALTGTPLGPAGIGGGFVGGGIAGFLGGCVAYTGWWTWDTSWEIYDNYKLAAQIDSDTQKDAEHNRLVRESKAGFADPFNPAITQNRSLQTLVDGVRAQRRAAALPTN